MSRPLELEELLTHSSWLRSLAASLVADPGRADDLVQDTWIAALRHPPAASASPRPWLARVFRNLAFNSRRAERTRAEHEHHARAERHAAQPDAIAAEVEMQRRLAEAVGALSEPNRTIVVLRYFRELDSAAISRELGMPAGTVRWRLKQALEELRAELDRRFGERATWAALLGRLSGGALQTTARLAPGAGFAGVLVPTVAGVAAITVVITLWRQSSERRGTAAAPRAEDAPEQVVTGASVDPAPDLAVPLSVPRGVDPGTRESVASESGTPDASALTASEELMRLAGTILVNGAASEGSLHIEIGPAASAPPSRRRSGMTGMTVTTGGRNPTVMGFVPSEERRDPARQYLTLAPEDGGRFDFGTVSASWSGYLGVRDHAFDDGTWEIRLEEPSPDLFLRVLPLVPIAGRVLDPAGEPAAGAKVAYELWYELEPETSWTTDSGDVRCGGDGRFEIPLQAYPSVSGLLRIEDERGFLHLETPACAPTDGHDTGDLVLEPVGDFPFRVLGSDDVPLAGAIGRIDGFDRSRRSVQTDESGMSSLPFAPARPVALRFGAYRHTERVLEAAPGAPFDVVLEPLACLEIELVRSAATLGPDVEVVLTSQGSLFVWNDGRSETERELQHEHGATRAISVSFSGEDPGTSTCRAKYRAEDRLDVVGIRPGVPFEVAAVAADGRTIAVRSVTLGTGETQRLMLPVE